MKKKRTTFYLILVVAILAVAWIVFNRDDRILLSRFHSVLEYEAEDINAIAIMNYRSVPGEYEIVRIIKPILVIGDKKVVKQYDMKDVPVEKDRSYIEKIYKVLNTAPKDYEGHGDMISGGRDAGLAFFTKDSKVFLLELILRPEDPPDKGKAWLAKIPCNELAPIITELLEKYGF